LKLTPVEPIKTVRVGRFLVSEKYLEQVSKQKEIDKKNEIRVLKKRRNKGKELSEEDNQILDHYYKEKERSKQEQFVEQQTQMKSREEEQVIVALQQIKEEEDKCELQENKLTLNSLVEKNRRK